MKKPGARFHPLPTLSYYGRFLLVVACFLLVGGCVLALHQTILAIFFAIPMILAAWFFRRRGALLCFACILLALAAINTILSAGRPWSLSMFIGFAVGGLVFLAEGFLIGYLRYSLELAHTAHLKAQQAEEQQRLLAEAKEQFLVNVTHELRTPLTELYGYLELLRENRQRLDEETQLLFLDRALHGCEELRHLVNNVLDAAHATNGIQPPRWEAFCLTEVVQEVLTETDPHRLNQYEIHLDVPTDLRIWADRQYTRQVLRNLLSNAFKYVPAHSPITIQATLRDHQQDTSSPTVRLCVRDAGPGIAPPDIPLLFKKFTRLPRELSGPTRGTGLGLYISKQLVEAMGGHIWVESTGIAGQGSAFYLTLPYLPQNQPGEQQDTFEQHDILHN